MVAAGLFLFGGSRHVGTKVAGALLIFVVFVIILGMLSDPLSASLGLKRTGIALALFFVPLGIVLALLKLFLNRIAKSKNVQARVEPPIS